MEFIPPSSFRTVPWKNGGGLTHEIAREDQEGRLLWRLSIAEVTADGPFSAFDGLTRILTVIEGPGMVLEAPDGPLQARPGQPLRFSGSLPVEGRLERGAVRNLNLIFDESSIAAAVTPLLGPRVLTEKAAAGGRLAVFCLQGPVGIAGADLAGNALAIGTAGHLEIGEGAQALLIRLDPLENAGR